MGEDGEGDGVEEDGEVGGPGEADDAEVLVERPVDGDVMRVMMVPASMGVKVSPAA